jgi:general secretion pathway protein A
MYKDFFGLRENPFNVNPDPRFLVPTQETKETLASLTYGVQQRRGFILLTGEVGTGKTTILNMFLEWLHKANLATAFIFNPRLNVIEFFDFMMTDFGIPCESDLKSQKLIRVSQWLLDHYRANQAAVLIIDEAQNLSDDVLEEIRLLTNLETAREKLLQMVLSGQPELEHKLNQPVLRQLRQRITLWCKTHPLTHQQVQVYINERLRIAGRESGAIFSPGAVHAIHRYSRGIPRIINLLCDHALITAYAEGRSSVPEDIIDGVAKEFGLEGGPASMDRQPVSLVPSPANGDRSQTQKSKALEYLAAADEREATKLLAELKGPYEPNS